MVKEVGHRNGLQKSSPQVGRVIISSNMNDFLMVHKKMSIDSTNNSHFTSVRPNRNIFGAEILLSTTLLVHITDLATLSVNIFVSVGPHEIIDITISHMPVSTAADTTHRGNYLNSSRYFKIVLSMWNTVTVAEEYFP